MSLAAHLLMFLFAAPAGVLAYGAIGLADHPEIDMRHLCGAVLLFSFVLIGMPDLTWAVLLYFVVGTILGAHLIGQERPTPPVQDRRRQAGPQPPRRAVHVDRELAWDKSVLFRDSGFDEDRYLRMIQALDREEYEELEQFWRWQRRTQDTPPQPDQADLPDPPQPVTDDIGDEADEIKIWTDQ